MGKVDPISLIPAGVQTVAGIVQMATAGRKKAQRELDTALNSNSQYSGSKPISDYYNEALNRYNVSPYQSQQYQIAQKNAQSGTATGLNSLQDRRSAIGGISRLVGVQNQSLENAGVNAENQRNQNFSQLGSAVGMKNQDDRFKFNTNVLDPYNRKLQLAMMKSQAANARFDAGLSNIGGGTNNASMLMGSNLNK